MPKLHLFELYQHQYQPHSACAQIFYINEDQKAVDDKNKLIPLFSEYPSELIKYLKLNIVPKINEQIAKKNLYCIEVDTINMAPQPILQIVKINSNGRVLTDNLSQEDMKNIHKKLKLAIDKLNGKYHLTFDLNKNHKVIEEEKEVSHRPITRSMTRR